jgi:hypothetical protein
MVLAIGEINQALPKLLLPLLDVFCEDLVYAVASSCLGSAFGVWTALPVLAPFGSDILVLLVPPHPLACRFDPKSLRT